MYFLDTTMYPFLLVAIAVTLMMLAGVTKRTLEKTRPSRVCPSCGRAQNTCRCRASSRTCG